MKNRLFLFCLLAALAVSCVKDQQEVIQMVTDDQEFFATIEEAGEPDTRVYANDQLRVRWDAGDHISIFNKTTYNREYAFQGETGDNSGSFKKVPNDDFFTGNDLDYIYAVYPYQESTKISDDGELTFILPTEQPYRENSFGLGANTMISVTEDNELHFKNVCGYFAVKLYGDNVSVKSISIKGNNNELLAGKATVIAQTDAVPTLQMSSAEATKELTLTCATPVTLGSTAETATTFWFVIPPTTFTNGFTLTVNRAFEKRASSALEIKRNTLKKSTALEVILGPSIDPIQFEDQALKAKLVAAFDTNKDGELSYAEAAAVTSGNAIKEAFGSDTTYESFDEFQYFTGISDIPFETFKDWTSLTRVTIPGGVTTIGSGAFQNCTSLLSITIPEGVTVIGQYAFQDCNNLISVTYPRSLLTAVHVFDGCDRLKEFHLSDISEWCHQCEYKDDANGTQSPFADLSIEGEHHIYLRSEEIVNLDIPNGVEIIGQWAFNNCNCISSVSLSESVKTIQTGAFQGCTGINSISIPANVEILGGWAFADCRGLSSVFLNEGLLKIRGRAFFGCSSVTSITIPSSVTDIAQYAFMDCSCLQSITIQRDTPPTGGSKMFDNTNNCPIYVPASSVDAYKTAQYWSDYANRIQPITVPTPEAVDLGLSVKWASFNLGATKPEEYGDYFAWGETEPYYNSLDPLSWKPGEESGYTWFTYKWCNGSQNALTKYNTKDSFGVVDNKATLDPEDDAAYVNWGENWRMPTLSEVQELFQYCTFHWTTENGVQGSLFTSTKEGYTNKSIFFPATGRFDGTSLYKVGSFGYYWSSSLFYFSEPMYESYYYPYDAYFYGFNSGTGVWGSGDDGYRYYGYTIRPVFDDRIRTTSITLNKSSLSLFVGRSEQLIAKISPADATDKTVIWSSDNTGLVTVDSDGFVTAVSAGLATITATTNDGNLIATCAITVYRVPEAIDLGLSVKWASFNLGSPLPEGYGEYYAWGETEPYYDSYYSSLNPMTWKDGKNGYTWTSYKWCVGSTWTTMTKYCTDSSFGYNGFMDGKTVLDPEDDAALVKLGGKWRMPTDNEWTELRENCTWTWTTQNSLKGMLVTAPNGNSIFLPAAGYLHETDLYYAGSEGYYWSCSLYPDFSPYGACIVYFRSSGSINRTYGYRCDGLSVRPVCP